MHIFFPSGYCFPNFTISPLFWASKETRFRRVCGAPCGPSQQPRNPCSGPQRLRTNLGKWATQWHTSHYFLYNSIYLFENHVKLNLGEGWTKSEIVKRARRLWPQRGNKTLNVSCKLRQLTIYYCSLSEAYCALCKHVPAVFAWEWEFPTGEIDQHKTPGRGNDNRT